MGQSALQVAMGVRADLFEPRAGDFHNARGEDVGLCRVGGLGKTHGYERMVGLAAPALREAIGEETLLWPVCVALPARGRKDDDERFETRFMQDVAHKCGLRVSPNQVDVVRAGHAGGVEVLRRASERLDAGAEAVVVGGVDSFHHPDVLAELDASYRIHAIGVDDGFIPGEAAAFIVLRPHRAGAIAQLVDARVAEEQTLKDDERPNLAEAITSLVRDAAGTAAPWVMTDVTGEHWRQREWQMVSLRHDLHNEVLALPASVGDVGAASCPLMVAIAATWWRHGCAPAGKVLLLTSSDGPERGVALLAGAGEADA